MVAESSISARSSLISLDPVLASHITATTRTTTVPSASQHGSSPRKTTKTSTSELSRRHLRNHSAPSVSGKKRNVSLRRVKNSTEVLRQRSTRSSKKTKPLETIPDTRSGRNFTVGNVGTGGILYLKPSAQQRHPRAVVSPIALPTTAPAALGQAAQLVSSTKSLSNPSVSSLPRSASPKRVRPADGRIAMPHHGRSQSFSTLGERRPSISASKSKTVRIVIHRPEASRPKTARQELEEKEALPTLEIPIPHYRIGTFRFSSHGTPMLRGSSYTLGSVTPSEATPTPANFQAEGYFGAPPMSGLKAFAKIDPAKPTQGDIHTRTKSQITTSSNSTSGTTSTSATSIQPEVFDDLTQVYDDPSVVRYCQNVREITAATPARIIAQISSDSFMDYELVSDFFLTFRSYMSTYTVLDLLMARLRWAIGRLEDDGRIIRVRTFAALRHWILNYFMDDFYADRRLRQRFCHEVNKLHADVIASPEHGLSDLKLLRDLKRCWNGRCSLCWDPEDFDLDGDQENEIQPGGFDETESARTPRIGPPRIVHPRPESPETEVLRGPSHSWFEAEAFVQQPQHGQASDPLANSLMSDGSFQPSSCFPNRNLLRPGPDRDSVSRGPHPVSVQLRRKNAPSNLQVVTQTTLAPKPLGHRRGASSIDSNREHTPRKTEPETPGFLAEDGDIIRGLLYSPSGPFVQLVPSSSTQSLDSIQPVVHKGPPRREPGSLSVAQPIGRNIFGSLRKVLGSKQGHGESTMVTVSQSTTDVPIRSHKSTLPLNVSKSHDELRNKFGPLVARKGEVRIDLLCAAVCQNYETKFPTKHQVHYSALLGKHAPFEATDIAETERQRIYSDATAQSGSILIVDDTGLDVPAMTGALHAESTGSSSHDPGLIPSRLNVPLGQDAPKRDGSIDAVATQRSSNLLGDELSLAHGSNDTLEQLTSARVTSGPAEHGLEQQMTRDRRPLSPTTASSGTVREGTGSLDIPRPSTEDTDAQEAIADASCDEGDDPEEPGSTSADKFPAHTLRRRPGGDLRRVENVQQLDHAVHHASIDTASVISDSPHESLLIMRTQTRRASEGGPPRKRTISMINTHSSQHLRPSFEAAVAGFSAIPDDDDGGLEATLMKLEGTYEKKSPPIEQHPLDMAGRRRSLPDLTPRSQLNLDEPVRANTAASHRYFERHVRETVDEVASNESREDMTTAKFEAVEHKPSASRRSSIYGLPTESVVDSEESLGSLPLLKRETAHESTTLPFRVEEMHRPPPIAPGYYPQDPPQLFHLPKGPPPSASKARHSIPRPGTGNDSNQSFLLDEDENLSDLSSEISVDIINYAEVAGRSISPMLAAPGTAISGLEIPAHPLTYASVVNLNVPEPPFRTSDPLPQPSNMHTNNVQPSVNRQPPLAPASSSQAIPRLPAGPAHLPFVLACDSQVLAQQMTLVEKSALCEVEWSDLVEMRWDNKAAEVLDWVECLAKGTIRGIDLVITRFNLVVKWALSEIVLTQNLHERARVITKYIHVAAHARRLHNYATMLQLTIALTSTDCTRLSKTWDMVSGPDRSLLKHMEALVQPIRNFHDLRLEMESADLNDGCVPFIGLYVHDLTYNAQKPTHIPGGRGSESLINFERYRTTAVIVKGLLRLIDASSRYTFEPVQGVIERCLWLAALGDDRIRSTSKALEP
ncbi:Guanine nucleotide exchange factor lte1 [Exophiala xenobiotica]|nr:Guanine nucleotide exchange factor lte1 [Exophiala xenobiotica]